MSGYSRHEIADEIIRKHAEKSDAYISSVGSLPSSGRKAEKNIDVKFLEETGISKSMQVFKPGSVAHKRANKLIVGTGGKDDEGYTFHAKTVDRRNSNSVVDGAILRDYLVDQLDEIYLELFEDQALGYIEEVDRFAIMSWIKYFIPQGNEYKFSDLHARGLRLYSIAELDDRDTKKLVPSLSYEDYLDASIIERWTSEQVEKVLKLGKLTKKEREIVRITARKHFRGYQMKENLERWDKIRDLEVVPKPSYDRWSAIPERDARDKITEDIQ